MEAISVQLFSEIPNPGAFCWGEGYIFPSKLFPFSLSWRYGSFTPAKYAQGSGFQK
jgi:hypothetical protein